jgi:uncharacterized protein (TIGR02145 family)
MKNLFTFFLFSFIALSALAQAPQKFSYQTVVRNASNQLLVGQTVGIKISILQGSANGSAVYSETHAPQTNANGLATLEIGGGSLLSGNFANINWANGPFFVKTETDPNGGNNYTITNTSQLLSVPYALYSSSANTATSANNGVPAGGTNGQFLTNCNGIATWTTAGQCPGTIASFDCASPINAGTLTALQSASGVSSTISYAGGGGGTHNGQTVTSTGVTGLTATITAGTFAIGAGSLTYIITGTPATSGTASFALSIGGQSCTLSITVNTIVSSGTPATCGATNVHNPDKTYGTLTDQQGNTYKTIVIGTQEWMAENLKTSIYRNGELIANVIDNNEWINLIAGAWCYYNNDSQNECPYGKMYNWYAVSDPRNLCPIGWHVPTDSEWTTLTSFLGGESVAGGKLKSTGLQYWQSPNTDATNESGFSGLPAGFLYFNGLFSSIGFNGIWWSSTEFGTDYAWTRSLGYSNGSAYRGYCGKCGLSVRCLRD